MKNGIDLHVHLDGSIVPEIARQLANMQNISLPEADAALQEMLSVSTDCKNLNMYLEKFRLPLSLLQTEKALETAARLLAEKLRAEGLLYAEVRFAPQLHTKGGMTQRMAVEAAISGFAKAKLAGGLLLCCMRGAHSQTENEETIALSKDYLGRGVLGVDLAGAEGVYKTENFSALFRQARKWDIPITIHAGEAAGPESVRAALSMGADRIGHGVRSAEDAHLLELLARRGTFLECCPTSNLQTRIFPNIQAYPARVFLEHGVHFSIHTDNIAVSRTTLENEWGMIEKVFFITPEEKKQMLLYAADAIFGDRSIRDDLRRKIMEDTGGNGEENGRSYSMERG